MTKWIESELSLAELEQIKEDMERGIMVSRSTFQRLVKHAIEQEETLRALLNAESSQ